MKLLTLGSLLIGAALVGCSSQPTKIVRTTGRVQDKADYVATVDKKLDRWQDRILGLKADKQSAPRAAVADARAELRTLQAAPESNWTAFRDGVDRRVAHIEFVYNGQKAE